MDTTGGLGTAEASDTADFSEEARMLSLSAMPAQVRVDRIEELRAELHRDEDQFIRERLAATVNCLCDQLAGT